MKLNISGHDPGKWITITWIPYSHCNAFMQLCSSRTKTAIIQNVFKIYLWVYRVDQTQHNKKICYLPHLDFRLVEGQGSQGH